MTKKWRSDGEVWRETKQNEIHSNGWRANNDQLTAIITKVYHPGDANPKNFEYLNDNAVRVELVLAEDEDAQGYATLVENWVWPLQVDPQLTGLISGSDGLVGKYVTINFEMPNLRATGEPHLNAINNWSNSDKTNETKYSAYLQQKSSVLSVLV